MMLRVLAGAALAFVAGLQACAANAAALAAPPGFSAAVRHGKSTAPPCPRDAPPYVSTLDFPSKYEGSDSARDRLNRKAEARYRQRTASITALEKGLSAQVMHYMRSGRDDSLRCAVGLMHAWSEANALEGEATTHTGKSMRKWALASVAAAYLRLKHSSSQPLRGQAEAAREIEAWLGRLAERVVDESTGIPEEKRNNHAYWSAWAVMATAVALDRRDLFDWSADQYRMAAQQIDGEGYLPNELRRETRALFYHNYALTPLAMMAAFGKANGIDLAGENDGALERLALRVLAGIDDPDDFENKTDAEQLMSDFEQRSKFAWLEPYCWTVSCADQARERLETLRPLSSTRLGGNLTELFAPTATGARALRATHSAHLQEASPWTHLPASR